ARPPGELLDPGQDLQGVLAVGDPLLVEGGLLLGDATRDGLAAHGRAPLPVGSVEAGWVAVAATALRRAAGVAVHDAALAHEAHPGELARQFMELFLVGLQCPRLAHRLLLPNKNVSETCPE